jgi:hypothetical protein
MQRAFLTALCPPAQDIEARQLKLAPQDDPSLGIIRVANWVKRVMHPDLEATGPDEYDLATIEPWLHEGQKGGGRLAGNRVYEHLLKHNMLDSCLGLRDGKEILKKGMGAFRKVFDGKALFLWKSVVGDHGDGFHVPFLTGLGDEGLARHAFCRAAVHSAALAFPLHFSSTFSNSLALLDNDGPPKFSASSSKSLLKTLSASLAIVCFSEESAVGMRRSSLWLFGV